MKTIGLLSGAGMLDAGEVKKSRRCNGYSYKAPCTAEELYDLYVNKKMSQPQIARQLGVSTKMIYTAMKKMGLPGIKGVSGNKPGPLAGAWKGGRVFQPQPRRVAGVSGMFGKGYYYIFDPAHPNAAKSGYVAEHVRVAVAARGSPLIRRKEVVHHINLNKEDNRAENLIICTRQQHGEFHNQLEVIAVKLLNKGLITFNRETGYQEEGAFWT